MIDFENKNILITGAGSGIGRALSKQFSELGATLFLVGRREDKLIETRDLLKNSTKHICFSSDISTNADKISAKLKETFGRLDAFVQNAAIFPRGEIKEMPDNEWDQVIQTNLSSSFYLLKRLIPFLKKSTCPRVLFISSVAGSTLGTPTLSAYAASKAGLKGLIASGAIELAPHGILINSIEPGPVETEFRENPEGAALIKEISRGIPLQRFGKAHEIAQFSAFLISEQNSLMTGQSVVVDGGLSIMDTGGMRYYRLSGLETSV